MTQMKLGASQIGGRLFKSAATSALALSALAGGVMLSGGEAQAAFLCNGSAQSDTITYNDTFLGITFTDTVSVNPTSTFCPQNSAGALIPGTIVDIEPTGLNWNQGSQKLIDTDFNLPGVTNHLNFNAESRYQVTKSGVKLGTTMPVDVWFDRVGLSVSQGVGLPTVDKIIYSDSGFTNKIAEILNVAPGPTVYASLPNKYSTIYIKDVYNANALNTIDSVKNELRDVPGPLPILGAGAAFGFSRKLRGRIKAARTA